MSAKTSYGIQSLHLYPIKSARGVDVTEMEISELGPRWDREWMVVDENGRFQTQRATPQMAQIETHIQGEHLRVRVLNSDFSVPLTLQTAATRRPVQVWTDEVVADDVLMPGLNEALSDLLQMKCRLVRYGAASRRAVTKGPPTTAQFRFADRANFLITTTASLEDLNARLTNPIAMERFRPNIVLKTERPWIEDDWKFLIVEGLRLQFAGGCGRCQIITQDPRTGDLVSREPLLKLGEFRRRDRAIEFGMHAAPLAPGGFRCHLRPGQEVTIEV